MTIKRLRTGGQLIIWSPTVDPSAVSVEGEVCTDTVTGGLIVGDGTTTWGSLPQITSGGGGSPESAGLPFFEDFSLRANGPVPAAAKTGQALTQHPGANGTLSIQGGGVVTSASTGAAAWYVEAELDGPVRYLQMATKFETGGSGGGACIGAFADGVAASAADGATVGSPAHVVVMPDHLDYGVFLGGVGTGGGNYEFQTFTYAAWDRSKIAFTEVAWDPKRGIAAARDPYGKAHLVTDPAVLAAIDIEVTSAFCEVQYTNAATNTRMKVTAFGADYAPDMAKPVTRGEILLLEAQLPTMDIAWPKAETSADVGAKAVSGLTNIASDLDVQFTAPPSGKVVITISVTIDYDTGMDVGLVANIAGTNGGLAAKYTASAEVAPSRRGHLAVIVKDGLVPGETYTVTPQTYTSGAGQVIVDAANFDSAGIVVDAAA